MSDLEAYEEDHEENTQINWFAAAVLAAGSPLIVLVFMNRHWAEVALKVYMGTAVVFGSLLLFIERKSLKKRWLWIGMIPLAIMHSIAMYGLVLFNDAFPGIDRFPVATYGGLVSLTALETGILYLVLDKFSPAPKGGKESAACG